MSYLSNRLYSFVATFISERTDSHVFSLALNLVFVEQGERNLVLAVQQIHTWWFSSTRKRHIAYTFVAQHKAFCSCFKPIEFAPCADFSPSFKYSHLCVQFSSMHDSSLAEDAAFVALIFQQVLVPARLRVLKNPLAYVWGERATFQSSLNFKCHRSTNYTLNCNLPQLITLINIQWNARKTSLDWLHF